MCLQKLKRLPRIATKDIEVYKIVYIPDKFPDELWTIFRNYQVEIGKTYKGQGLKIKGLIKSLFTKMIKAGYIHSFSEYSKTIMVISYPYSFFKNNKTATIVKCIIPKGTLYFIGCNGEIASRKLKYVELCA